MIGGRVYDVLWGIPVKLTTDGDCAENCYTMMHLWLGIGQAYAGTLRKFDAFPNRSSLFIHDSISETEASKTDSGNRTTTGMMLMVGVKGLRASALLVEK